MIKEQTKNIKNKKNNILSDSKKRNFLFNEYKTLVKEWNSYINTLPKENNKQYENIRQAVRFAFENARDHGEFPVSVGINLENKLLRVRITDSGKGFDYETITKRFHDKKTYSKNYGCGFKEYFESNSNIKFANNGRTIIIETK